LTIHYINGNIDKANKIERAILEEIVRTRW